LSFPVIAGDFHALPKDFLFGNHIDTHQENKSEIDKDKIIVIESAKRPLISPT
jgi:hypothetical protein